MEKNNYLHKNKKSKFVFGPIWDFNLAMGNLKIHDMQNYKKFLVEKNTPELPQAFYFRTLWANNNFKKLFKTRYLYLRQANNILATDNILATINNLASKIKPYAQEDQKIWSKKRNSLFNYFLNTAKKDQSFMGNIDILKKWLAKRLEWLDAAI